MSQVQVGVPICSKCGFAPVLDDLAVHMKFAHRLLPCIQCGNFFPRDELMECMFSGVKFLRCSNCHELLHRVYGLEY
jgi:hypothetical protein